MTPQRRVRLAAVGALVAAVAVGLFWLARDRKDPAARVTPEDEGLAQEEEPRPPMGVLIEHEANRVVRKDAAGNALWATPLEGHLGRVRPPHAQADEARAYVTHADGVTALDIRTGAGLWHSPGPADRMLLSNSLLLATECGTGEEVAKTGRWVTAREVKTGKEVFRIGLPVEGFDPLPIEEAAGLFLVQTHEVPGGEGLALLFDRTGRVVHRFDRRVVTVHQLADGGRLVLTSRDVVRLTGEGVVKWSAPFRGEEVIAGGGFVPLPEGDVAAFLYGRINDSGVQLVRLDPVVGGKRWAAYCKALGTTHSEYRHTAVVKPVADRLRVTSRGSHGTFVEVIDVRAGRSLGRDQRK